MKRNVLLLALIGLLTFMTGTARKRTFHLADYGILPNTTATDISSRLNAALAEIARQLGPNDEAVIKFKRGRYDLHAADAAAKEVYVSNHDQDQPKRIGICIENWKNLTLDGRGADFICHGRMVPLALIGTTDITLKNFSIDFASPQIGQALILKSENAEGMTFKMLEDTPHRIAQNGRLELYGEGWAAQPIAGIAFEGDTRHIVYRTSDLVINTTDVKQLADGTLHAPHWKDSRLTPGTRVALRTYHRPCPGLFLDECTRTKLQNINVHYAEGMGLIAQRCTDVTLRKFNVCLRGKDDPRYFTTQADATHFSQCRGLICAEGGLYEGMMDDAINIHGIYLKVRERLDDHTLRCRYEHYQAWGFNWGDVGDSISFVRSSTMETVGNVNTIAAIRPGDRETVKGCREFIITFKDKLPDAVSADEGFGVENLTWTPEVIFRKNTVRNNRARGVLFSSPRRTLCERNLFDHTSGTAILLCGDCNGWYESGAVRDLVIRKNTFINALTNMFQFTNAVISIYPEIPDLPNQRQYFHGGRPGSIVIEDNKFITFDAPLLYAKSVHGLVFKDNKVTTTTDYKPFHWNQKPVLLEHCKHAVTPGYVQPVGNKTTLY